jgi:REP element-mobilizing transposase RayT
MAQLRRIITRHAFGEERQFFHCVSRVVNRDFVFLDKEREKFADILRAVETFAGIRVLTWTILSNHFHVLLEIPVKPTDFDLKDVEFWHRIEALYSDEEVDEIRATFRSFRDEIGGAAGEILAQQYRQKFLDRMLDLSEAMKTLKQRFSMWFNRLHDRVGTLWESRFKSVLVEGDAGTLMKVAAYVDLNAVRAGMVTDPKDYRWCGYAEALGASSKAIREKAKLALSAVVGHDELAAKHTCNATERSKAWKLVLAEYRKLLFGVGDETMTKKGGFTEEEVRAVWAAGGKLTQAQLLRCRVRYFTDGLVIGSKAFVEDYFDSAKNAFGSKRKTGARPIRGAETGGLYAFRDLKSSAIGCA